MDSRLPRAGFARLADRAQQESITEVEARALRKTVKLDDLHGQPKPHVAALGETLYTDHLITVELAGALLFVALVGALAIAAPKPPVRPGARPAGTLPTTVS